EFEIALPGEIPAGGQNGLLRNRESDVAEHDDQEDRAVAPFVDELGQVWHRAPRIARMSVEIAGRGPAHREATVLARNRVMTTHPTAAAAVPSLDDRVDLRRQAAAVLAAPLGYRAPWPRRDAW